MDLQKYTMPVHGPTCASMNTNLFTQHWKYYLIASCTLGLAPFSPEPHIWGKLKWIAGGAHDMQAMDWFDVLLHGTPWVLLLSSLILMAVERFTAKSR